MTKELKKYRLFGLHYLKVARIIELYHISTIIIIVITGRSESWTWGSSSSCSGSSSSCCCFCCCRWRFSGCCGSRRFWMRHLTDNMQIWNTNIFIGTLNLDTPMKFLLIIEESVSWSNMLHNICQYLLSISLVEHTSSDFPMIYQEIY